VKKLLGFTALSSAVILSSCLHTQTPGKVKADQFRTEDHPRVFATRQDRDALMKKIETSEWAKKTYQDLKNKVDPLVKRHETDPQYAVSRLQMNWEDGKRHTHFWGGANKIARREGNAPYPTVRVAYGRVGAGGRPSYDRLEPYGDGSLTMNRDGKWQKVPFEDTGLGAEDVNMDILDDAYRAAVVYYFTGEKKYAKFAADLIWTVIRGASYQVQLNPDDAKVNPFGYLSYETLGDSRRFATIPLTYDFIYYYLMNEYFTSEEFKNGRSGETWAAPQPGGKAWALERIEIMFQKFIDNKLERGGGLEGNWNLNEQQSAILYALAMDDNFSYANGKGREYYVSQLIYGPTREGHGAFVDVIGGNLNPETGLWPEPPAGYGQGSIAQLVQFGYWYFYNGIDVLGQDPLLRKGALSFPQVAFPNGYSTGWGDANYSTVNQGTGEYMVAYARAKGDKELENSFTGLLEFAGGRNFGGSYYSALFFYVPELGKSTGKPSYPRVSYSVPHSLIFERNLGDNAINSLAYTVYGFGEKSGHRHRNGMSMELYGRGHVLAPDPGAGPNYWHDQHNRYNNQVGSHNTVVPNGIWADRPQDLKIENAEPELVPGADPKFQASELFQFTDTSNNYAGKADQRRVMGIVRTSQTSGYYLDIFRSKMKDGKDKYHDYIYHNMGKGLVLSGKDGNPLELKVGELDPKSGPGYDFFQDDKFIASDDDFSGVFDFGADDVKMKMWMSGEKGRMIYSLTGPNNFRYYLGQLRNLRVPTVIVRQEGEAWTRPFAAIYEPFGRGVDAEIKSVRKIQDASSADLAGFAVVLKNGDTDTILNSTMIEGRPIAIGNISFNGIFAVVRSGKDGLKNLYLGAGNGLTCGDLSLAAAGGNSSALLKASLSVVAAAGTGEAIKDGMSYSGYSYSSNASLIVGLPCEVRSGTDIKSLCIFFERDGKLIRAEETKVIPAKAAGGSNLLTALLPQSTGSRLYIGKK